MSMNDIQGVIMILAILLAIYLLARTIFLMVYRLVRKKPWVGKALWWTTVLCGVAALFGPRNGSIISSVAVIGMLLLLLGKVRWVKPSENRGPGFYTSLGDAMAHGASVSVNGDDGPGMYV